MLLFVDGLKKSWDGQSMCASEYEGRFGDFEYDDFPLALQHLLSPEEIRAYDSSKKVMRAVAKVSERNVNDNENAPVRMDGTRNVGSLSLNYFRDRLVEHFDIKFKAGQLQWPTLRGKQIVASLDRDIS